MDRLKILILGGYGVFGGRLARLLRDDPRLTLLIAGRNTTQAVDFAKALGGAASAIPLTLDRMQVARAMAELRPGLVVDASGPFQAYGRDPYVVPKAAIAAGIPYLDLADGADFVAGIAGLDAAARAAGVFVLSGVSSFPVLTHAVLAHAARDMTIRSVTGGIAPSPYAGVGMNVLRAVLGYAGSPVRLRRDGRWTTATGLGDTRIATIAVPGHLPLQPLRFSLVEVPDLCAIPKAMPQIDGLWMGAAPQPAALHRILTLMAGLRARLRLPSFAPLAPLAHVLLNAHPMGEHRGGMFLHMTGTRDGLPVRREWHLLAEGDDGPLIPSMAVAALVGKMLAGAPPVPGARPALGALDLADYDACFQGRTIHTGWRDDAPGPLYRRVLGPAFSDLPPQMQALHQPGPHAAWSGEAQVERGKGPLAALVAQLFSFPTAGAKVPVRVSFTTDATGRERWDRSFSGRVMTSTQEEGRGRFRHLIVERFGPFAFGLGLHWTGTRLRLVPRRWTVFGLPLPRALLPRGDSWETVTAGRFHFHVEIALPPIGPVVRYDGWLTQSDPAPGVRDSGPNSM